MLPLKRLSSTAAAMALFAGAVQAKEKPNVLLITVDDLKPLLGCYGNDFIKTPNIDRLAARGTVMLNNYCQQAVCAPSRMSFFTGFRPDTTKVWDLQTNVRDVCPQAVTLQQYFKQNGYETAGCGKVLHGAKDDDPVSWSVPFVQDEQLTYPDPYGVPADLQYQSPRSHEIFAELKKQNIKGWLEKKNWLSAQGARPAVECMDVPDDAYPDGAMATWAIGRMQQFTKDQKSFFITIGFHKPHLPFVAPKKYWDLYDRAAIQPAPFQTMPKDAPEYAGHKWEELRGYSDIPDLDGLTPDRQVELIHAYYACVSYIDAQVGRLLDTLDASGLASNTVIVLWGDHGWHLGDHGLWCKHTNYEQATKAPLIIAAPGFPKSGKSKSMTEFVDVYPTVCELAGLPIPGNLEGSSLVPILKNPSASVKEFSISQYPRGKRMGYTLRNERYRLVLWMKNDFRSTQKFDASLIDAVELYDYEKDPLETVNRSKDPEYKTVEESLQKQMIDFFKSHEL